MGNSLDGVEVTPGIRMLPLRTPTLPPATHTNSYLIGTGEALFVEPSPSDPDEIARAMGFLESHVAQGIRIHAMILTHHHWDHVGAAEELRKRFRCPIWAHRETASRLKTISGITKFLEDKEPILLHGQTPLTIEVLHTPGHAPGHLCLWEPKEKVVIAGDLVAGVGTILVDPHDGDMELYLQSLRRIRGLAPRVLLPAHGEPIWEATACLDRYVQHRLWREQKIIAALAKMATHVHVDTLLPTAYDDVPQTVWELARMSVLAHLIKLERDGVVIRENDHWALAN